MKVVVTLAAAMASVLLVPALAWAGGGGSGSGAPAVPALLYVIAQIGLIVVVGMRRRR